MLTIEIKYCMIHTINDLNLKGSLLMKNHTFRTMTGIAVILLSLLFVSCKFDNKMLDAGISVPGDDLSDTGYPSAGVSASAYYYVYSSTALPVSEVSSASASGSQVASLPAASTNMSATVTTAPVTQGTAAIPSVSAAPPATVPATQAPNYAAYTPAQVVDLLSKAVNKTKGYTGAITVHHKESFDNPSITNVQPGGAVMQPAIDFVVGLVVKPTEENYKFSGGYATTSEGEQTQLLLPKSAAFTLNANGVQSATASQENGMVHVRVTLKPEQCTSLTQIPAYNASAIGYLDISSKFSVLKIQQVNIQYPGSTIDAYIRPDGYVQSVTYVISLSAHAQAQAMGITGSADFSGNQTEVWNIQWQ